MKNTSIENKLEALKEMIRKMNSGTVELINYSAAIELSLRGDLSDNEIRNIENEIDKFIKKYTCNNR